MDAATYVRRMAELGGRLRPNEVDDSLARRRYIERLLAMPLPSRDERAASTGALDQFRTLVMPRASSILRGVAEAMARRRAALPEDASRELVTLEGALDLLGLVHQVRDEVVHTKLIADLLAEGGPSPAAVRHECLEAFTSLLRTRLHGVPEIDLRGAKVRAEVWLDSKRRVDIVLDAPRVRVFVEAKIDASESDGQLDAYGRALDASCSAEQLGVLVFLTAREHQVATTSRPHVHITFADLLRAWLPIAAHHGASAAALAAYLKSVATHLGGLCAPGPFERWPLPVQRRWLELCDRKGDMP